MAAAWSFGSWWLGFNGEDKLLFISIESLQENSNLAVKSGSLLVALSEGESGRHSVDVHWLS